MSRKERRFEILVKPREVKLGLKSRIDELAALYDISKSITSKANLDKMLGLIVKRVAYIMRADICMIHLLSKDKLDFKASCGAKRKVLNLKRSATLKDALINHVINAKRPIRIDEVSKISNDIFCRVCKNEALHSVLMVPLIEKGRVVGILTVCSIRARAYSKIDEKELTIFASQASLAYENTRLFEEIKYNYLNTMKLLASVIDAKDTYTEDHSERVMRTALGIANVLGLAEPQKLILRYAGMLHDIGKIGIDVSILRKVKPLTKEEWRQIRRHPTIGADIVKKAGFLDDLIPAILYHHVKYSGGGYPLTRKKKDAIPVEARILSVADAYEAMRSNRTYRQHLSNEDAIGELKRYSGTQFDPKVVNAFTKYLKRKQ